MYVVYEYMFCQQDCHEDTSVGEIVFATESHEVAKSYCNAMNMIKWLGKTSYSYSYVDAPVEDEIFVITRDRDDKVVNVCFSEEEAISDLRRKKIPHTITRIK